MLEQENHQGDDEFNGTIRSIHIKTAKIFKRDNSYIEDVAILSCRITFDAARRKIEETSLSPDGSSLTKKLFTYDTRGRLVEVKKYVDEQLSNKAQLIYHAMGKLKMELTKAADGTLLNKTVYNYDHTGRSEASHYDSDGSLYIKLVSKFDEKGRIIEAAFCGGKQSRGLLIRHGGMESKIMPIDKTTVSEGTPCDEGFLFARSVMTYDDVENKITIIQYRGDGALLGRMVFLGNNRNKETEIIRYHANDSLYSKEKHIREFDSWANWVKDTKLTWNIDIGAYEPTEARFRHFVY